MDCSCPRSDLHQALLRTIVPEIRNLANNIQADVISEFRRFVQSLDADCVPGFQGPAWATPGTSQRSTSSASFEFPWKPTSTDTSGRDAFAHCHVDIQTKLPGCVGETSLDPAPENHVSILQQPTSTTVKKFPETTTESPVSTVKKKSINKQRSTRTSFLQSEIQSVTREMRMQLKGNDGEDASTGRACVVSWVRSEYFDYVMGVALLLNAVHVGVQTNYMADNPHEKSAPMWVFLINVFFCVIFALEWSVRVFVHRTSFWIGDGWRWNLFDTIVVSFTILDELSQGLMKGTDVQEVIDQMGVLRMLRIGRVIRLVRMVRLIPELKSLVYLIMSSMLSFFWTLVLMLILMYCVAVYFTQIATDLRSRDDAPNWKDLEALTLYWGTIQNSIVSLFMSITGGDDWRNISNVFLGKPGAFVNQLLFCAYIAWATLVMLNLVTGVFVEGANRIVTEDRRKDTLRHAAKFFVEADLDSSHELTREEFDELMQGQTLDEFLKNLGINVHEAGIMFDSFDEDGSGDISLVEFVAGCLRLGAPAKSQDTMVLKCLYRQLLSKVDSCCTRQDSLVKCISQVNQRLKKSTVTVVEEIV
eukprot:TRINITY_DN48173_c0_g1_i1.p1 TRINITY_DN48173_c0_g1~~TRINITY_DN48173_c0_g1_i1.p1  ORF type:complete len:588 (+),score=72.99 TRINITY_DN48173_c0_g1_i1:103-1866(+)